MRILAFTTDASLEVALASLDERFEIVAARDPEGALAEACRSDLALIALGSTERGASAVAALHRLRVGIPCLIVGDEMPGNDVGAPVLVRPFALSDLTEAMVGALQRPPILDEPALPDPEPVAAEPEPELTPEPFAPPTLQTPAPDPALLDELDAIAPEAAVAPEPAAEPAAVEQPATAAAFPDHETVEDLLRQLEAAAAAVPAAPVHPPADPVAWALAALHEIGDEPRKAAPQLPADSPMSQIIRQVAAPVSGGEWLADRGSGRGLHRLRRRRRAIPLAGSARASIMRRVRSALEGARELESLLDEIPALCEPGSMARALVRETVELLGCETAALYAADADAYRVVAAHGLSPVEQSIVVPRDQALLCDIANRLEAVLVAPVDLVRGLVAGIAGSTTEALMLAPLEVDGRCAGILLAGRSRFGDEDLERLWHLAEEAAPGFAASRLIERIRHRDLPVAL